MEIVSLARHAYKVSMVGDPSGYWRSYWTGFGEIKVELPACAWRIRNSPIVSEG
jgi:hypothetical protein